MPVTNQILKKIPIPIAGVLVLFAMAVSLLWYNYANSLQATRAFTIPIRFEGEYRIGDGPWETFTEGQHIPATKGDVILRGNFHRYIPDGEYLGIYDGELPVAFYTDHIGITIQEAGNEPYIIDHENPLYGVSGCGVGWTAYHFSTDGSEPFEILIQNPHRFGNETAIDDMLSNVAIWGGIDFERDVLNSGKDQRNIGLFLMIVSFGLVGTALFSVLLHIDNNRIIWFLGFSIMFAGMYLLYSAPGVSFWSDSIIGNTTILGISMMFYMLLVSGIITYFLQETKRIGILVNGALGVLVGLCLMLPIVTKIYFYDTWMIWAIAQTIANVILAVCLIKEGMAVESRKRPGYAGLLLLPIAFEADVCATALGIWKGGFISKYAFFILFMSALFVVLRIIPESINAAVKARELELQRSYLEAEKNMIEAELKERRISIMLSQIRPHFIYNTLGTIERMCLTDPEKAFQLVRNFSMYLRGNFSELDSVTPIRFMEEMKHVEYYVNIEKVRFPDISIIYDMRTTEFVLPALSVQPLVENAIKHGLMRLESGGTVKIRSYESETHFYIDVEDDGLGFDPTAPVDEKKHVGLRNIRGRLKAMVNGELMIQSKQGSGTIATIMIPKE